RSCNADDLLATILDMSSFQVTHADAVTPAARTRPPGADSLHLTSVGHYSSVPLISVPLIEPVLRQFGRQRWGSRAPSSWFWSVLWPGYSLLLRRVLLTRSGSPASMTARTTTTSSVWPCPATQSGRRISRPPQGLQRPWVCGLDRSRIRSAT